MNWLDFLKSGGNALLLLTLIGAVFFHYGRMDNKIDNVEKKISELKIDAEKDIANLKTDLRSDIKRLESIILNKKIAQN